MHYIEVPAPYFLFGTQRTSEEFWSLPEWKLMGVTALAELGHTDPIYFIGWEMVGELANEIRLFQEHFKEIEFDADTKSSLLAHLVYCYNLLMSMAPQDSSPELTIG